MEKSYLIKIKQFGINKFTIAPSTFKKTSNYFISMGQKIEHKLIVAIYWNDVDTCSHIVVATRVQHRIVKRYGISWSQNEFIKCCQETSICIAYKQTNIQ